MNLEAFFSFIGWAVTCLIVTFVVVAILVKGAEVLSYGDRLAKLEKKVFK